MKFVGLVLLVAAAATSDRLLQRAQVAVDAPLVIDNNAVLSGATSRVTVACAGAEAALTLTQGTTQGQVLIRVGASGGPATCTRARAPVSATGTAEITAGENCARRRTADSYEWDVLVSEFFTGGPSTLERRFDATFTVRCSVNPADPAGNPGFAEPPAVAEGLASFSGSVAFTLASVPQTNPRIWVLTLTPDNVDTLQGFSYQINDLTASTGEGDNLLTAQLVDNGCNRDPTGVSVVQGSAANQQTTVTIAAFQFTNAPAGAEINFDATVTLCTPTGDTGICAPVRPADDAACVIPPVVPEPEEPVVPGPAVPDTEGKKIAKQGRAARISTQRVRRSLKSTPFGNLFVKVL